MNEASMPKNTVSDLSKKKNLKIIKTQSIRRAIVASTKTNEQEMRLNTKNTLILVKVSKRVYD